MDEEEVPLYDDEWARNNECETYPDQRTWDEGMQDLVEEED